jgi:hypothetical protein
MYLIHTYIFTYFHTPWSTLLAKLNVSQIIVSTNLRNVHSILRCDSWYPCVYSPTFRSSSSALYANRQYLSLPLSLDAQFIQTSHYRTFTLISTAAHIATKFPVAQKQRNLICYWTLNNMYMIIELLKWIYFKFPQVQVFTSNFLNVFWISACSWPLGGRILRLIELLFYKVFWWLSVYFSLNI